MRRGNASILILAVLAVSDAAKTTSPKLGSKKEHPLIRPVCGAMAACTAEAMTMPIDMTKVCELADNRLRTLLACCLVSVRVH